MTDKKLLFLIILAFLQTACTQNPLKPSIIKKTTQARVSKSSKSTAPEAVIYKNEAVIKEETPLSKTADPIVNQVAETKPRPILSPAVQALMADADKNTKAGDLDSASVMLERALRISPRNAELTYQLAALRLKQSQPGLAEDLGKKAAFLAADDRELKKQCWLLIAQAREQQGNSQGAKEARLKADSFE